jgi:PKHD-type hydroxylase
MVAMLNLKSLLTREELATINAKLDGATWVDGRETASGPTRKIKNNLQLGSEDPLARELGPMVEAALLRHELFIAAAFPDRVAPIRFAAYGPGMTYGWHADLAHMRFDEMIVRADVACTVFLSAPETYQGGELAIRLPVGELRVKFQAGDAVVYPATTMHRVEPVTAGTRRVALTWIQSLIPNAEHRDLLFDMHQAVRRLRERDPENEDLVRLNVTYQNFARLLSI